MLSRSTANDSHVDLSIIIPAYREAARIEQSLQYLATFLGERSFTAEVIVVAVEHPDGTAERALANKRLFEHLRVIVVPRSVGKGFNVRTGMAEAVGRYRLFMDADLATPLGHIDEAYELLEGGADVAIGVRDFSITHQGIRRVISSAGNVLTRALLVPGVNDTQCGFKAFSATAANDVFRLQSILGWGFDIELLVIARQLGYAVEVIHLPDWKQVKGGSLGNVKVIRAAARTLRDVVRIRRARSSGRYALPQLTPSPAPALAQAVTASARTTEPLSELPPPSTRPILQAEV